MRKFLRILTSIIYIVILLLAYILWEIQDDNFDLELIKDHLVSVLNESTYTDITEVESLVFHRAPEKNQFEFLASNIVFNIPGIEGNCHLKKLAFNIDYASVLKGQISPTYIEVDLQSMSAVRSNTGEVKFKLAHKKESCYLPIENIYAYLMGMTQDTYTKQAGNSLTQGHIINDFTLKSDHFNFKDELTQRNIILKNNRLSVNINNVFVQTQFYSEILIDDNKTTFEGTGGHFRNNTHYFDIKINDLWLPHLEIISNKLKVVSGIKTFANTTLNINGNAQSILSNIDFYIQSEKGTIYIENILPKEVSFTQSRIQGNVNQETGTINLKTAELTTNGTNINYSGELICKSLDCKVSSDMISKMDTRLEITNIDVKNLLNYWPINIAKEVRNWFSTHINEGYVNSADFLITSNDTDNTSPSKIDDNFQIDVDFKNVGVKIFEEFDRLSGVTGTAVINQDNIYLETNTPLMLGEKLKGSALKLYADWHHIENPMINIEFFIKGKLPDVLETINQPPLSIIDIITTDLTRYDGEVSAYVKLSFPNKSTINYSDVHLVTTTKIRNLKKTGSDDIFDLQKGDLVLSIDGVDAKITGTAVIADLLFDVEWESKINIPTFTQKEIILSSTLSTDTLVKAGILKSKLISGVFDLRTKMIQYPQGKQKLFVSVDLTNTKIVIPQVLTKQHGEKSHLTATVTIDSLNPDKIIIQNIDFQMKDFLMQGEATLTAEGELDKFTIKNLKWGKNDFSAAIGKDTTGRLIVAISGQSLDMTPYITKLADKIMNQKPGTYPDISILGTFAKVYPTQNIEIEDIKFNFNIQNSILENGELKGVYGEEKYPLLFTMKRNKKDNLRNFRLEASNSKMFLDALIHPKTYLNGQELVLTGEINDQVSTNAMTGQLIIKNLQMEEAATFAHLLQFSSLIGILEIIKDKGLTFQRLDAPFTYESNTLTFNKINVHNLSLGISMKGKIDIKSKYVDLEGSIIPVYVMNKILSIIPIMGTIFTGEFDEIFGMSFTAKGELKNPKIQIQPLTILFPGFIVNMLKNNKSNITVKSVEEQKNEAAPEIVLPVRITPPEEGYTTTPLPETEPNFFLP